MIAIFSNHAVVQNVLLRTMKYLGYNDVLVFSNDLSKLDIEKQKYKFWLMDYLGTFRDGDNNGTGCTATEYIGKIRTEKKDKTPVIFFGYTSIKDLKKNPGLTILQSLAVEYIEMPFIVEQLKKKIDKVTSSKVVNEGLDERTARALGVDKVRIFKHNLKNAINTIEICYKLKRSGEVSPSEMWEDVRSSMFEATDLIEKNMIYLDEINKYLLILFSRREINVLRNRLKKANDNYKNLIKHLKAKDSKKKKVLDLSENITSLLNDNISMLEKVKE